MSFCFKFVSWVSFPIENLICCSISSNSKILHSDLFLIFLQLLFMFFCLRYFENFHSHWSLPVIAAFFSWGFFAVVKNCDKLNVRGECYLLHTRCYCCTTASTLLAVGVGGCHIFSNNTCRERGGKTLYFLCFCFIFSFSPFLQLLEFLLRAVCNIYSRVILLLRLH